MTHNSGEVDVVIDGEARKSAKQEPQDQIGKEVKKVLPDGKIHRFVLGDISGDCEVDQDDLEILQHMVNNTPIGQFIMEKIGIEELMACDIDGNGIIDQRDFMLLCSHVVSKMEELARTDELTGLDNRRALKEKANLKIMACKQFKIPISCLFLDIDGFKKFNDIHGHDAGDLVLQFIAEVLKKNTRASDIIARYGGDEFVIILDNAPLKSGVTVAQKIMNYLGATPLEIPGASLTISMSIGVSEFESHMTYQRFLKQADLALYKAKGRGKNMIETLSAEVEED